MNTDSSSQKPDVIIDAALKKQSVLLALTVGALAAFAFIMARPGELTIVMLDIVWIVSTTFLALIGLVLAVGFGLWTYSVSKHIEHLRSTSPETDGS